MEIIPIPHLSAWQRRHGAVYRADKTADPSKNHIYYLKPSKRWALVQRHGAQHVKITYYNTCPCALMQASAR